MILDLVLVVIGALFGAVGIGLLAVAAHASYGALDYAATMLLVHAAALTAIGLATRMNVVDRTVGRIAGLDLAVGVALFSADISCRTFTGDRLFPMAAPSGGVIAIAGWLILGAAAVIAMRRKTA